MTIQCTGPVQGDAQLFQTFNISTSIVVFSHAITVNCSGHRVIYLQRRSIFCGWSNNVRWLSYVLTRKGHALRCKGNARSGN